MRSVSLWIAVLLLAGFAAPAGAAPLNFSGTLTIELLPGQGLPLFEATGSGSVDVAPTGGFALPGGAFVGSLMTTLGTPPMMTAPLTVFGANGPGSFTPGGVASLFFGGVMPVVGAATFVSNFLPLSAPLSVVGGSGTFPVRIGQQTIPAPAAPWQTGSVSFLDVRSQPRTLVGLDGRTGGGLGPLQLIAPVVVPNPFAPQSDDVALVIGSLTLEFTPIPEPASALLFGAGLALLAFGVRRRA